MTANLGPPGEGGGDPHHQAADHTTNTGNRQVTGHQHSNATARQLRARRAASRRLPALDAGRSDTWWYPPPGARGYPDAVHHLLGHGLTPAPNRDGLRAMFRAGGHQRRAAELIAERLRPYDAWLATAADKLHRALNGGDSR